MKPESNQEIGLYFWQHNMLTGVVQCSNRESELTPRWHSDYRAWTNLPADPLPPKGQLELFSGGIH